jgi:Ca-activated chloride channel homolog
MLLRVRRNVLSVVLRIAVSVVLAVGLVAGTASVAGASGERQDPQQTPQFQASADVTSIIVPVTVRDGKGRIVTTLEQKDFRLHIDALEVPVSSFWREGGLALSLALVIDVSGSMAGRRLAKTLEAVNEILRLLRPDDEICIITFGGGEVKRRLKFEGDRSMTQRIVGSLQGYGTTALYDMLSAAPQVMEGARNIRRAALLFTDGVDTASSMSPDQAVAVLQNLADPLYAIGIEPPPDDEGPPDAYEELLRRFAAASGGRYLRVDDAARLPVFARELRQELGMRYILAFQTSSVGMVKWRKLEVGVPPGLAAQARHGYVGTLP